jgi:hypothetical protein
MCVVVVGGDILSFMRPGGILRYVDGMSGSYVYFNGDDVVDYGLLTCADFIELVFRHAADKDNEIVWDYLVDRAELFMDAGELVRFRKWSKNRQLGMVHIRPVINSVCKRNGVALREVPLE